MHDASLSVGALERYVLLDTAKEVAISAGDVDMTLEFLAELEGAYDVDSIGLRAETAKKLARMVTGKDVEKFSKWAAQASREAIRQERYKDAERLVSVAVGRAYKLGKDDLKEEMRELREAIDFDRDLRHAAEEALEILASDPEDGES